MLPSEWVAGLAGGLMIGTAAAFYLLVNGRIMGASGIVAGAIDGSNPRQFPERALFIIGLIGAPALAVTLGFGGRSAPVAAIWLLVVAGFLVGFGARIGNGCTSGHGVCGISRLSRRGIVATATFLVTGALAVVISHLMGWGA